MNLERKKIPYGRKIRIPNTDYGRTNDTKVFKENLLKAMEELKEGDEILSIEVDEGYDEPGFGSMSDEKRHWQHMVLFVKNFRDETDEEYLKRCQETERKAKQDAEAERLLYLRLKAKYEN